MEMYIVATFPHQCHFLASPPETKKLKTSELSSFGGDRSKSSTSNVRDTQALANHPQELNKVHPLYPCAVFTISFPNRI